MKARRRFTYHNRPAAGDGSNAMNFYIAFSVAIAVGLGLTVVVARATYLRGLDEGQALVRVVRTDAAVAMEHNTARHQQVVADLEFQLRQAESSNEQTYSILKEARADISDLRKACEGLTRANVELTGTVEELRGTGLSHIEVELIEAMSQKLRLASPALHASQQFADARQAKILSERGAALYKRLHRAEAEAAA